MRWSEALIPTTREEPQEAEIVSHKLMLRAGLIRRLAGGLYTFLPLGLRALRKVEQIIRDEMDGTGALEVLMPALQPREIWDRSKRYEAMGDVMFRVKDRQNREMALGPTHEEVITELVSREIKSYRQLPRTFYQIQTKFRDEIRPRFGLMRAKEFIMKDAYSFDVGWDEADRSYRTMYDAYTRIFARCGLKTRVVEADTGAMGGKWSHEFMVLAESGEDGLLECDTCSYAANVERAERALPVGVGDTAGVTGTSGENVVAQNAAPEEVHTPGCKTIEQVSQFLKCPRDQLVKTLIYRVDGVTTAILAPGDRDANESKIARALGAESVALADDMIIEKVTGAPVGFSGPVGLGIPAYADLSLQGMADAVTGANKADTHLKGVRLARDAKIGGYHDLCFAREGDSCPRCEKGVLRAKRGIEVGHVFKLGTKYSENFDARYLDIHGRLELIVMGCYGIGVTRTLQAIIEQSHDENGIIWPMTVAPYRVVLLVLNTDHRESQDISQELAGALAESNIDVLLDDRDERPGVKFKDADLLGFPVRVVVSERSLAGKSVEIKLRAEKKTELANVGAAAQRIAALCG